MAERIMETVYAGAMSTSQRSNATLLSIAPTGTLAMLAGCSYSIEPQFALFYTKRVELGNFDSISNVLEVVARNNDYVMTPDDWSIIEATGSVWATNMPNQAKHVLKTANEIPWRGHVDMQVVVQRWVDNAVSKTINLPNRATVQDVRAIIQYAHAMGLKGLTVYRNKSRENEVICANGSCGL